MSDRQLVRDSVWQLLMKIFLSSFFIKILDMLQKDHRVTSHMLPKIVYEGNSE